MTEPTIAPYGSWRSPLRIDDLVGDVVSLAEPWVDGDDVYWLEGRPAEGGRQTLIRLGADGVPTELTPAPISVRSRVHEYGGGSYVVAGGVVVYSDHADGRLYRLDPGGDAPVPITPGGPWRYADMRFDPSRRRFVAVREDHSGEGEPVNQIVDVPLDGERDPRVLVTGPDFVAAPRISPDGGRLAWLEWDHPHMPWEATRLRVAPIGADGTLGEPELAAGGPDESIAQPEWSADGTLHLVSDRSGWWNLYRLVEGPRLEPLAPMEAEFADPAWVFGRSSYGFLADGSIVAVGRSGGHDRLFHITPGVLIGEVETPFTEFDGLRVGPSGVVATAGSPDGPTVLVRLDPETLAPAGVLRRTSSITLDQASISLPEAIDFTSTDGRIAHALYYPPRNPWFAAPDAELPPLMVVSHGGPTSNASSALDLGIQFLTSRGIAVVDVDYGGSTGYGREYRHALDGAWGIVDVDDCVAAASFLVDAWRRRPATSGYQGSERWRVHDAGRAGPFTTGSAPGSAPSGWGTWRCWLATRTSSSRATSTASSGRIRRVPTCIASARRSTALTRSRARCWSCRALTTRWFRRPRPRRSSRRSPPTRSHTPTSCSRVRATGSAANRPSVARLRRSCRSSARSSASSLADAIEPVAVAGLLRSPGPARSTGGPPAG